MAWRKTEESIAIGRRVREERIRAGLSRTDLAQLIGSSPDVITAYESGYHMSDLRLSRISKQLGRSFDYMKTGEGLPYPAATDATANPIMSLVAGALEPMIRRIAREEAERVLSLKTGRASPRAEATKTSRRRRPPR